MSASPMERVLIVTKNLWKHTLEPTCIQFINHGIERNVRFDILFNADELHNKMTLQQVQEEYVSAREDELRFFPISGDDFLKQAVTDYILLIPYSQRNDQSPQGYIKVPTAGCEHWIKVDDEAASGFLGRFDAMIDEELKKQSGSA